MSDKDVGSRRLDEIPLPHVRYFDNNPDELRRVVVRIGAFTGYGLHFHVTMREEPDPVWASDSGQWEVPLDDPAGAGRERMMKFRTHDQAVRWAEATFESEFGSQTHTLEYEEAPKKWHYREGD